MASFGIANEAEIDEQTKTSARTNGWCSRSAYGGKKPREAEEGLSGLFKVFSLIVFKLIKFINLNYKLISRKLFL